RLRRRRGWRIQFFEDTGLEIFNRSFEQFRSGAKIRAQIFKQLGMPRAFGFKSLRHPNQPDKFGISLCLFDRDVALPTNDRTLFFAVRNRAVTLANQVHRYGAPFDFLANGGFELSRRIDREIAIRQNVEAALQQLALDAIALVAHIDGRLGQVNFFGQREVFRQDGSVFFRSGRFDRALDSLGQVFEARPVFQILVRANLLTKLTRVSVLVDFEEIVTQQTVQLFGIVFGGNWRLDDFENAWLIADHDSARLIRALAKLAHLGATPIRIDITRRHDRNHQQRVRDALTDHPDEILVILLALVPPNLQLRTKQHREPIIQ